MGNRQLVGTTLPTISNAWNEASQSASEIPLTEIVWAFGQRPAAAETARVRHVGELDAKATNVKALPSALVFTLVLTGCTAIKSATGQSEFADLDAAESQKCIKEYGVEPRSPAYGLCLESLKRKRGMPDETRRASSTSTDKFCPTEASGLYCAR